MVFASIREHAEHCDFLRARAKIKNLVCELASNAKIWEHEQASTRLNFASKSSKGKILRQLKILTDHSSPLYLVRVLFPVHSPWSAVRSPY